MWKLAGIIGAAVVGCIAAGYVKEVVKNKEVKEDDTVEETEEC